MFTNKFNLKMNTESKYIKFIHLFIHNEYCRPKQHARLYKIYRAASTCMFFLANNIHIYLTFNVI